ncbi:MAG: hypothetical protein P4L40_03350 [Terracidiphilus sp.]|nr:hypothetical protein [Terracidiphilus sp.]
MLVRGEFEIMDVCVCVCVAFLMCMCVCVCVCVCVPALEMWKCGAASCGFTRNWAQFQTCKLCGAARNAGVCLCLCERDVTRQRAVCVCVCVCVCADVDLETGLSLPSTPGCDAVCLVSERKWERDVCVCVCVCVCPVPVSAALPPPPAIAPLAEPAGVCV